MSLSNHLLFSSINGAIFLSHPIKIEVMTAVGGTLIEARRVKTSKVCERHEGWRVKCTPLNELKIYLTCVLLVYLQPATVTAIYLCVY